MGQRTFAFALTVAAMIGSAPSLGAEDPSFGQDLKAAIALQRMPCDTVVDVKRNGDSDYLASCKDGNRYHVFVNTQGRVVVRNQ